jgi:hypothetical protein
MACKAYTMTEPPDFTLNGREIEEYAITKIGIP